MAAESFLGASAKNCPYLEKLNSEVKVNLYDRVVNVRFEDSKKVFNVHRGLICHYSEYFRGAFKGMFAEGKSGEVTLPKDELKSFESFFSWLYTGSLFQDERDGPEDGKTSRIYYKAVDIYLFAEMRGAPAIKNVAIDILIDTFAQKPRFPPSVIRRVYENTARTSDPLRKFWVEALVGINATKFFAESFREEHSPGFLFDICRRTIGDGAEIKTLKSCGDWKKVNKCEYHDHTDINTTSEVLSMSTR